jgi:NAD(P)-dependent dehydrogenase (short-subunit alcohol dehydrogenase family)
MTYKTDHQPVLVTGCSSGIGYHVARRLRENGYPVIASARKKTDVEKLRQEGFTALKLDLDSSGSIREAFERTLELTNGQLYGLFNNGAYGQPGAVEDLSREVLRAQLETNLLGWHELTNLALPVMRKQGYGRIIYNSSILGFVSMAYRGAYNCSKYALEGLVDTLRLELKDTDIHVCLIEPGPILSDFRKNALEKFRQNINIEQSFHREQYEAMLGRLNKQGPAAPFTLSPEAVYQRVEHALQSRRPKVRYPVTFPTYLFAFLKRLLQHRTLDSLLIKASGDGKR